MHCPVGADGSDRLAIGAVVDAERFAGTCYRAANWIHVGTTQ